MQVVQTERVSQTSRSIYILYISYTNGFLGYRKIFAKSTKYFSSTKFKLSTEKTQILCDSEEQIQKLPHNFVVNPEVAADSGRFLTMTSFPVCRQNSFSTFLWLRRSPFAKVEASVHEFDRDLAWIACSVHCRFPAFFENSAALALTCCRLFPAWTVAVCIMMLACHCVWELPSNLLNWASDGTDDDLFRTISDLR